MDQATKTMIENLEEWVGVVKKSGLDKHGDILKMLKEKHAFTHGYANLVSMKARESAAVFQETDDLVEAQYKGKESLLPIY